MALLLWLSACRSRWCSLLRGVGPGQAVDHFLPCPAKGVGPKLAGNLANFWQAMGKRALDSAGSPAPYVTPKKSAVKATQDIASPLQLSSVDMGAILKDKVHYGNLINELSAATQYCISHLNSAQRWVPKGGRVATSTPTEVLERLNTTNGVQFGGALSMLDLEARVKTMESESLDLGRMRWGLDILATGAPEAVHKVLGAVAVQAEQINDKDEHFNRLLRIERDTDIDSVLLAIYWGRDHPNVLEGLVSQCQDIVFCAQRAGQGLELNITRFIRMDGEDSQRLVSGQSAWRKAMELKQIVELGGSRRDGRSDAALAAALICERDAGMGEKWGQDTCRRYLHVASRMDKTCQEIMVKWEFVFQRTTLVDPVTNMRAAATACHTSAQMVVLLETLFFEQTCRIRRVLVAKRGGQATDLVNLFRGILLRDIFYKYCRQIFPELEDSIKNYGKWAWYKAEYGVSESGLLEERADSEEDGDEDQTQEGHEGDMRSRYVSMEKLSSLMDAVAKNKHEAAFTALAKGTPMNGHTAQELNMSFDSMRVIHDKVQVAFQTYQQEFPPKPEHAPPQGNLPDATLQVPADQAGVYAPASVRTSKAIQNHEEYTAMASRYMAECRRVEAEALQDYVEQRIVFKVSAHETKALLTKLKAVRLLTEPGRKLFIYDALTRDPVNWKNLKKARRSCLTGAKVQMQLCQAGDDAGDTLAVVKNIYLEFSKSTCSDSLSENVIVALVPGNSTDSPENPTLATCWKSLKAIGHKFIGPKIGNVKPQQEELLQQIYTRGCWNRCPENHMVFTYQASPQGPNAAPRKKMRYLSDGGVHADTYFNTWPVPVLPLVHMPKTTMSEHESIFAEDTAQDSGDSGAEDGAGGAAEDDLGDNLIPFPREHHVKLTREMIHVWDIDVGVVLMPGSGQSLLAFILENKKAVAIAKNPAHKKFLMKNLTDAVKNLGLAQHNPPPKPTELAVWEKSQARDGPATSLAAPLSASSPPPVAGFGAPTATAPSVSAFGHGALPAPHAGLDAPPPMTPRATPVIADLEAFGNTPLR